ncbi:MAG: AAA family ATPase [Planctomycetota bacterium]
MKNIRCFEEFELEFKKSGQCALFAADNGDGKTTLLRSMAMGLCDETSAGALLRDTNGDTVRIGKEDGTIKITLDDGGKSWTITTKIVRMEGGFERLRQRHYPLQDFPWQRIFVCAYGANRRTEGDISYDAYSAPNAVYTLFNYDYPLQNPELAIRRYAKTKKEQDDICSWLTDIIMRSIRLTKVGIVVRDKYGNSVPLGASADGYRAMLACICDMLGWALLAGQKNRESNVSGIVLIDEIEQHLHPRWQLKIMDLLHKTFPKIQFIVGTHSPLVVSGCKECAVHIINRGKHKRTSVYGWLAEDVYREVMDMQTTRQEDVRSLIKEFEELHLKRISNALSEKDESRLVEVEKQLGTLPGGDPTIVTARLAGLKRYLCEAREDNLK